MAEQKKPWDDETRVAKLIPKLTFPAKQERGRDPELFGWGEKDKIVWRQLEKQASMADQELEKNTLEFSEFIQEYPELQDMISIQKALKVINSFGRLLVALDGEKSFILGIIKDYIDIAKSEVVKKRIEMEQQKDEVKKIQESITPLKPKEERNRNIYKLYKEGLKIKVIAERFNLSDRAIRNIIQNISEKAERIERAEKMLREEDQKRLAMAKIKEAKQKD